MNWLNRFFRRDAEKSAAPRVVVSRRNFEAGSLDRLFAGWKAANLPADEEIRGQLDTVRARARELARNSEYVRKYLALVVTNVVGPSGFTLQSLANDFGTADRAARDLIEAAFAKWSRRGTCEITGQYAFADLCRLVAESWARDGETLILKMRGRAAGNPYGYALRVVDVARLPVNYTRELEKGRTATMGVEIDDIGRVVAYWLNLEPARPYQNTIALTKLTRVDAADVIHVFKPYRAEQRRGFPSMHAVMAGLKMLDGFEEAAIVAARVGASKMGFFTSPDGAATGLGDDQDGQGNFITEADAGSFDVLPQGYKFESWNPEYPHAYYESFMKSRLRSIASGLLVSYHSLANDLEGVNFSSIRSGTLEERDNWMVLQNWFIEAFMRPVFIDWIQMALTAGAITYQNGSTLPISKLEKFSEHAWQGRRWSWVDPYKDAQANAEAVRQGFKSRTQVIAEQGLDRDEVWQQLADENLQAAALKLVFGDAGKPLGPAVEE